MVTYFFFCGTNFKKCQVTHPSRLYKLTRGLIWKIKLPDNFFSAGLKMNNLIIELKGNFLKWEILCWKQAKQFSRNFFPSLHNSSQKVVELTNNSPLLYQHQFYLFISKLLGKHFISRFTHL